MPAEGRGLSSRPAYQGAREPVDWREPRNSTEGSETPDDAACQSEGIAGVSVLRPLRQGVPEGHPGVRLPALPLQRRRPGGGRPDLRGHRGVRARPVARRTDDRTERANVSTRPGASRVHPERGRQATPVGDRDATSILPPHPNRLRDSSPSPIRITPSAVSALR